jgi:hypothetical protein
VPKAFEFAGSFSKLANFNLVSIQKWKALCCPLFKKNRSSESYLVGLKTGEFESWPALKSSWCSIEKICHPIRAKGLNSSVLKSFQHI